MGWFSSSPSSPSPPAPKISTDGTPIAPGRSERAKCWEARDIYFKCLDIHDIVDSIKEGEKAGKECAVEGKGFEANCATSWVSAMLLFFYWGIVICKAIVGARGCVRRSERAWGESGSGFCLVFLKLGNG
jgi:hypothetical protein